MKSKREQLMKRGFVFDEDILKYKNLRKEKLLELTKSKSPQERSIAVRLLGNNIDTNRLLDMLINERALYTKIELCNSIQSRDKEISKILGYLGKIGNNHHKEIPNKVSMKRSYPLPRDIIARVIGNMDPNILPLLIDKIDTCTINELSELIDAIGFMIFYNKQLGSYSNFKIIQKVLENHKQNLLIVWKCIQCLSAFQLQENIDYLISLLNRFFHNTIQLEINRSLSFINKNR